MTSISGVFDFFGALNPSGAEVQQVFFGLGKLPPEVLKALVSSLDEAAIRKLANWAEIFVSQLNAVKRAQAFPEHSPNYSDDFIAVMAGAKFLGDKLDLSTLDEAQNEMTKAIKAENWKQALWVGFSLGRMGVA